MKVSTWQSWVGAWKELKQWCLQKVSGVPEGAKEGAIWYDTTKKAPQWHDGTNAHNFGRETLYAGVVKQPTITQNVNSIVIGDDGVMSVYTNSYYTSEPQIISASGKTLVIPEGVDTILAFSLVSGYHLLNTYDYTVNMSDVIAVCRYIYEFGILHSSNQDALALGQSEKSVLRTALTGYYERVGNTGVELSMNGLVVNISAGKLFNGAVLEPISSYSSNVGVFSRHVLTGTAWTRTTMTSVNTSIYNPTTGETTLPTNKWSWVFVYRTVGNDVESVIRYGEEYFNDRDKAKAGLKFPTTLSATIKGHCVLVGYMCYESGSTTIDTENIFSAWQPISSGVGSLPEHNNLSGKDGGDVANNYFGHVTAQMLSWLTNAGLANGMVYTDSHNMINIDQIPVGLLGGLTPKGAWNPSTNIPTLANPPENSTRGWFYIVSNSGTALGVDWASGDWCISDGTIWQKIDNPDNVTSVFGRTGQVVAQNGDYSASMITNVPSGNIVAINVQTAINELDSEKAPTSHASTTNVYGVGDANNFGHVKVDAVPTNGSNNAVSSNGVFDAISSASIAGYRAWADGNAHGAGAYHLLQFTWPVVLDQYRYDATVIEIVTYAAEQPYNMGVMQILLSVSYQTGTFRIKAEEIFATEEMSGRGRLFYEADSSNHYVYVGVHMESAGRLSAGRVVSSSQPSHRRVSYFTSNPTMSGESQIQTRNTTIITANATLPAGAPIGKTVISESTDIYTTIYAPSGESIIWKGGTGSSPSVTGYSGTWFTKVTSNKWRCQ